MIYFLILLAIVLVLLVFRRPVKRSALLLDIETKSLVLIEKNRIHNRIRNLKSDDQLVSENSEFWSEYK